MPEFESGWEFRDRQIWNFNENDVSQITLHQDGKTRVIDSQRPEQMVARPGFAGIINPPAIEETAHRFGELTAAYWLGRNITEPEKLRPEHQKSANHLRAEKRRKLHGGFRRGSAVGAHSAGRGDGGRGTLGIIFPPVLYQFVSTYLTVPANVP